MYATASFVLCNKKRCQESYEDIYIFKGDEVHGQKGETKIFSLKKLQRIFSIKIGETNIYF